MDFEKTKISGVAHLFNNPDYSDIRIKLSDNTFIYAHKLILHHGSEFYKSLFEAHMREVSEGVISLPEHSDNVIIAVVQYIYGIDILYENLSFQDWYDLLMLANYTTTDSLINDLILNIPKVVYYPQLFQIAYLIDREILLVRSIRKYLNEYEHANVVKMEELINEICETDWDVYKYFHSIWVKNQFDVYSIVYTDCNYCKANSTDKESCIEMLNQLLIDVPLEQMTPEDFSLLTTLYPFKDEPIYIKMLKCMQLYSEKIRQIAISGNTAYKYIANSVIMPRGSGYNHSVNIINSMQNSVSQTPHSISTDIGQHKQLSDQRARNSVIPDHVSGDADPRVVTYGEGKILSHDPRLHTYLALDTAHSTVFDELNEEELARIIEYV